MSSIWATLLYNPILNLLLLCYKVVFSNLGFAIILMTLLIRFSLLPLVLPSLKSAEKQKDLKPELDKLKEKHKGDKKALSEAQMELYKKHGLNPMAGCLPQIVQLLVLIALYRVFIMVLGSNGSDAILKINELLYFPQLHLDPQQVFQTKFLWLNLGERDPYIILPALAGAAQLWASKLMLPKTKKAEKLAEKTPDKSDDVMYNMQEQMLYMMPIMTVLIGWKLPSGLALYWLATTLFSLGQQMWVRKTKSK